MNVRFGFFTLMSASLLATACVAAPEDVPEDAFDGDLTASPLKMEGPIGLNGLDPVHFWAPQNQQALRTLGAGALLGANGALGPTPLLATEGGQHVLGYALRCALDASTSVPARGGLSFEGDLAIAPAWTSRALTTSEQRWMTACLLQQLNGVGAHVPILLTGAHPALVPEPGVDTSSYEVDDATTFGNLFASEPSAYVCADLGVHLGCGVGLSLRTLERLCGLSPTCGITVLGLCALTCSYSPSGAPTCGPLLGPSYTETIASRVEETGFLSLYPLCDLL